MNEQLNFFDKKQERKDDKEKEHISDPYVKEIDNLLYISFLITKDNGDQIEVRFIFDLNKGKNQKPKIEKRIVFSNSRAFENRFSMDEVSEIEPKYFNLALKQAYAIFYSRLEENKNKKDNTDDRQLKFEGL